MVRRLHLELLTETLPTVSKPTTQLCSRISERCEQHAHKHPRRTTKLALCQRLGLRTCHRRARYRRLHPERGATRWTPCYPALLLPASSSGSRDNGLVRGKWRSRPYYLVFRDTNDAPLRCSSCLAGRRYDRLSG